MDINTKKLKKNAFRVTKHRGITASRVRVPGGHLDAKYLPALQHIAETYGNGQGERTEIKIAELGNDAGILGAAVLGL